MEKRRMDNLGIETSLLGFGCMRFPLTAEGKIEEEQSRAMLDEAIASGVNYIDTAYPYHDGESEPFVGKALAKYARDSYYLATKLPVWKVNTMEDVETIFYQQLERLRTEYIDFYLLHALDKERWEKVLSLGIIERLEQWRAEGKIRYLGFSFHDEYEVFEEILNYRQWDFCQIQLNYMDAQIQAGLKGYRLTEEKGVPLIIMEPVKGGSLARLSDDLMEKFHVEDKEGTAASMALRWVGSLSNVKVILSGMSDMGQVKDNLKTFSPFRPLSEKEQEAVKEVVEIINGRIQNGCTGCRYCMPCPAGVNIPGCFSIWNLYHMYQNEEVARRKWKQEITEAMQAKNCIKCGKCEQACPQRLHIREDLEKVQRDMDAIQA